MVHAQVDLTVYCLLITLPNRQVFWEGSPCELWGSANSWEYPLERYGSVLVK